MSKRKKNYPDPGLIVQNYGADALRSDLCLNVDECVCVRERESFCGMNACAPVAEFCVLTYLMLFAS